MVRSIHQLAGTGLLSPLAYNDGKTLARVGGEEEHTNMAQVTLPVRQEEFGATTRRDAWWLGPLLTVLGLAAFVIYSMVIVFSVPGHFEIRANTAHFFQTGNRVVSPYLAPFSS